MNNTGFTLIELLIVISVLGILVALILPRFGDVRESANTKVCVANLRGLASAMAIYETRNNGDSPWGTSPFTAVNLVYWGYIAAEPFCPYEQQEATPGSYTLVPDVSGQPDRATCPNVGQYNEHVWP